MSEAILEQQEQKNMDADLSREEQLYQEMKEAEAQWVRHFQLRPSNTFGTDTGNERWSMALNDLLWREYKKAEAEYRAVNWERIDAERNATYDIQPRDPNDYQEEDNVPADPQEKDGNESSNY